MLLSIVMPVYNEASTVAAAVKRTLAVELPCESELIVVDDGSTDGTAEILAGLAESGARLVTHPVNRGKGAALRSGAAAARGDYIVTLDADLEYAPEELDRIVAPVLAGDATVVYGTRTFGSHSSYSFWYVVGNKAITLATNVLYNVYLSDVYTCFKLLPLPLYRELDVRRTGFDGEIEMTAKLLRRGIRPYEVPISYRARSREEGKKIDWTDGVRALAALTRIRLSASPER